MRENLYNFLVLCVVETEIKLTKDTKTLAFIPTVY